MAVGTHRMVATGCKEAILNLQHDQGDNDSTMDEDFPGYTPCRLPTATFMARARALAGTTIVLKSDACTHYSGPWQRDKWVNTSARAVEFTVREALFLTANPLVRLREVYSALSGAGPVPLVVPELLGDEGALFGDSARVVIVKGLAALTPEWAGEDRVTLSDMAAADVVVFPLRVAEALCGPQKRVFDLTALQWRDGMVLVRYSLGRRAAPQRRLKRFRCAMFWQVVHDAMWPVLSPVYSPAVLLWNKAHVCAYARAHPNRLWIRHLANHE
jgi:hypothetical protein